MATENQGSFEERVLRRVPLEIIVISATLAVAAALVLDLPTGLVFFAGGALAALTFAWLRQSVTRLLQGGRKGTLRSGIALYALRLALICAAFFLIILVYPKKILAFGAGFSVVVLVSLVEGIRALLLLRTWKA